MSFDLNLFSGKLRNCRINLKLEIDDVCSRSGLERERLNALEDGQAMPSGDEILMFSDFYKQDYQFFITNEYKTAFEQVQMLYRKHGNAFSQEDRWVVQEFIYLCECEQIAYEFNDFNPINFNYHPKGSYFIRHGSDGAKALREKLGLRTDSLIHDPYRLFRKLGIHVFRRKLANSSISGLFILHPKAGKCVLVNYDEDIYRQNFTVAHEVAHAIFDANENVNISFSSEKKDYKEIRANAFASAFLIPDEELTKRKNYNWNDETLLRLAIQLKVNTQPLLIALKTSGVIDDQVYNSFKGLKVPRSEKVDPELLGLSEKRAEIKLDLLERGLSEYYVKCCHQAYENGGVSAQRLSEMLLVGESELPELLSLFNLKLSYEN